jgi:hypothetical protein
MAELPNWLRPADPAAHFMEAFRVGAQIQEANQRLAQSARQTDQQTALERQRLLQNQQYEQQRIGVQQQQVQLEAERSQQEMLRHEQQIEMTRAYRDEQMQLQKARLDEAAKYNQARTQQAAAKFAQQQQYQQTLEQIDKAVDAGQITKEDGDKAKARAIVNFSGQTATGGAAALRYLKPPNQAQPPAVGQLPSGQPYLWEPGSGKAHLGSMTGSQTKTQLQPAQAAALLRSITAEEEKTGGTNEMSAMKADLKRIIQSGLGTSTGTNAAPATAAPSPAALAKAKTSGKRVRVKSPKGQIGSIPEEQVDAALKAGYTRVEE